MEFSNENALFSQQSVHQAQKIKLFCILVILFLIWRVLSHSLEGISHHFQNFSRNLNFDGRNIKWRGIVLRKISLFSKMQRGKSSSFELLQLDMYAKSLLYGTYTMTYFHSWDLYELHDTFISINLSQKHDRILLIPSL